jgi:nucleotide-binding universal stress UspA family protein
MLKLQSVLVAYDGSPASERWKQPWSSLGGAPHVVGLTVRPPTGDAGGEASTELVEMMAAHAGSFGGTAHDRAAHRPSRPRDPGCARTHRADLIVLGHSGRSAAWGRFLGTTAEKVAATPSVRC